MYLLVFVVASVGCNGSREQEEREQKTAAPVAVRAERAPEPAMQAEREQRAAEVLTQQRGQTTVQETEDRGIRAFQRGDYREAMRWFKISATEHGNVQAYQLVAVCYSEIGNMQEARRWFQRGAEAGCDRSQYMHGLALLNSGIERRDTAPMIEGRRWVQRSAAQGNQNAITLARELERAENTPLGIAFALQRAGVLD